MRPYFTKETSLWDIHRALTEAATRNSVTVFVDMDGVIADFHKAFVNKFRADIDPTLKKIGWKGVETEYPTLFADLPRMPDASILMSGLLKLQNEGRINIHILTALPDKFLNSNWYAQKLEWIDRYYSHIPVSNIHIVERSQKQNFVTASKLEGVAPVLIDDYKKNINEWQAAGGFGIVHTSATSSLNHLMAYLRRYGVR